MKMKRLTEKYTPEELAESFVFRSTLTRKEQEEADKQLNQHREKFRAEMTPEQKLETELLRLKLLIEDYLKNNSYDEKLSAGHFLRMYIDLIYPTYKAFAEDIDIKTTELSQLLNSHRAITDKIAIRLEYHSNSFIPATSWIRLVEKEKEYDIMMNKALRTSESKHVKRSLFEAIK